MEHPHSNPAAPLIQRLAGIDARSLAAFRIGLGLVLIWDLSTALLNAKAFYSNSGVVPVEILAGLNESPWIVSLHSLSGTPVWQIFLIALQIFAALLFLVGCRTQVAIVCTWILLCSLQGRNPAILHGGDTVLRLLCFWAMFLPTGSRWSWDAQKRGSGANTVSPVFSVATLALLFQTALIYWITAMLKYGNEWTRDGTAVYYALSVDQFVKTPGLWLLSFPEICRWLTFGAWWLEILGPFFAFLPWKTGLWRTLIVAAFVCLHFGFGLCLRLGPFPMIMVIAWIPYLPSNFWDRLFPASATPTFSVQKRPWFQNTLAQSFALLCLIYIVLWNLRSTDSRRWSGVFPTWLNPFGYALRLDQYWALFAPKPLTDDGWLVLEATLADGSKVDLLRNGQSVSYEKPKLISVEFPDYKWQKLEINLYLRQFQSVRIPFARYFATRWNEAQPSGRQVKSWMLNYMRETTLPHYHAIRPEKIELERNPAQ